MLQRRDYTWKEVIQEEQESHNETLDTNSKHCLKHTYGEERQLCSVMFPVIITLSPGMLKVSFHVLSAGVQDGRLTSDLKQTFTRVYIFFLKKKGK